jgi:caffeoyl-CoA O-methyltransferase
MSTARTEAEHRRRAALRRLDWRWWAVVSRLLCTSSILRFRGGPAVRGGQATGCLADFPGGCRVRCPCVPDDPKSFFLSVELQGYLLDHCTRPDDVQQWLIDETRSKVADLSMMQIAPEQGAFMTLLTRLLGVRSAVEVGTFTGYSALCIARGLVDGGRLLCCDVSEEWTAIGREAWSRAGVEDRIELAIAPAIETLRALPAEPTVDLAFIDADKPSYPAYFEELVPRLRPDGVLLVDNTLWSGAVVDPTATDENTEAIRAFNDMVTSDARVESTILTLGDGLTVARKR